MKRNKAFDLNAIHSLCERTLQGTSKPAIPSYAYRGQDTKIPSLQTTGGSCAAAPRKQYTGTAMLGVATMHKSNAVPVFSESSAAEISSMRR